MGQYDVENTSTEKHRDWVDNTGAVPGESFVVGDSLYHKLQRFAGKMNMEQRGIERVPDDERTDTNTYKIGTMVLLAPTPFFENLKLTFAVASRKHGRELLRHWSSRQPRFRSWICRRSFDNLVHQRDGNNTCLLLLYLRPKIRIEANDLVAILLWLLWSQSW
jgi:hypothetical protein